MDEGSRGVRGNPHDVDDEEGFAGSSSSSNIPKDVSNDGSESTSEFDQSLDGSLGRKKTSQAWDFFHKPQVVSGVVSTKVQCKACKEFLTYESKNDTSHLIEHSRSTCRMRLFTPTEASGQSKLRVKSKVDGTTTFELKEKYNPFDQNFSRTKLVDMVVMHEYPLSIVDHLGFREFVKSLNTSFKMISRNTLRSDIMKSYMEDKLALKELLMANDSRIAVTTDMWTASNQKEVYMVVTSHFIDQRWVLRNRTLRFCFVPRPHTKGVFAKILMDCLYKYCLESKVSSIVVDNCTTNDAMMKILRTNFEEKCLMLKGSFLHLRCSAHILNLIVKDGLDVIGSGIERVRDCISFWMSTPKRIEKFEAACRFLAIPNDEGMVLDCKTRWSSTYLMLLSALPYKDVFVRLKHIHKNLKFVVPSDDDWNLASLVCDKLKIFHKATKIFSVRRYPTSSLFFRKACEIKLALRRWRASDDCIIKLMAQNMIEKFDQYWGQTNGPLAVAAILDPRNKMDCVEFYFEKIYGDEASGEIKRVRKLLDDLVGEYESKMNECGVSKGVEKRLNNDSLGVDEDGFAKSKRTKKRKVDAKGEVDHYLEYVSLEEDEGFDILGWWKDKHTYPTLQKIAKDILAIPISSVASESAFSMGGRVISAYRSRLHASIVEASMCLQNWKMQNVLDEAQNSQASHGCSTMNEDSDGEEGIMDIIDMDVDDIPLDQMNDVDD